MPGAERVRIGVVVRPHGVRGELVVRAEGETLGGLSPGAEVWVGGSGATVLKYIRPHQGRWLVTLSGTDDRQAAERLRGAALAVEGDRVARPGEREAYVDDLVGCRVERESGELVGEVTAVLPGAAHDLLEVRTAAGPRLVPMVRDWLVEFEPGAGRIVLSLPAGLLDGEGPDGG